MQKSTLIKLYKAHTQTKPVAWPLEGISPSEWVERIVQPSLSNLTGLNVTFDKPFKYGLRPETKKDERYQFLGVLRIYAKFVNTHWDKGYRNHVDDSVEGEVSLFWVVMPLTNEWGVASIPNNPCSYPSSYRNDIKPAEDLSDLRYFRSIEDMAALLGSINTALNDDVLKLQKNGKVRALKINAVKAQIQQIANAERFSFYIETTARCITILIKLEGRNQLRISVPFTEFEQVLPELRDVVLRLRSLNQRHIHCKTEQQTHSPRTAWIDPES
ncbi:MAG: hypothetical protein ACR2HF_06870 [Methylococcaceae bacterium]